MDVFRLIDELEQLVENGRGRVFGKVMINEEEFYAQTTRLKKALPEDLKKAEHLSRSSSKVLADANAESKRLVDEANSESTRMVTEARQQSDRAIAEARQQVDQSLTDGRAQSERIVEDARAQSQRIIEDSRREAERIVADAKARAEQMTSEHTVTQNAQQFAQAHQQAALEDAEGVHSQADEYAMQILDRVENVLHRLMGSVEDGKRQLREQG